MKRNYVAPIAILALSGMTGIAVALPEVSEADRQACALYKEEMLADLQGQHARMMEGALRAALADGSVLEEGPVEDHQIQVRTTDVQFGDKVYTHLLASHLTVEVTSLAVTVLQAKAFGEVLQLVRAERSGDHLICSMALETEDGMITVFDEKGEDVVAALEQSGPLRAEILLR